MHHRISEGEEEEEKTINWLLLLFVCFAAVKD